MSQCVSVSDNELVFDHVFGPGHWLVCEQKTSASPGAEEMEKWKL